MLIAGKMRSQTGFTLIEMLIVVFIIGLMAGTGIIMVVRSSAGYSRKATAEIVKQEVGKVYSLADDAVRHGAEGSVEIDKQRDRYVIVVNDYAGDPPNAYKIVKKTWNGTALESTDLTPDSREANKIISGTNWIKPSTSSDIQILVPGSDADPPVHVEQLVFRSKGSIMTVDTDPPGGEKWIKIKAKSSGQISTIDVSDYGETPALEVGPCGTGAGSSILVFGLMTGLLGIAGSAWVRKLLGRGRGRTVGQ